MKCYLCQSEENEKIKGTVRDIKDLAILKCKCCGLVFLDHFVSEEFYENDGMDVSNQKTTIFNSSSYVDTQRRFKDFGLMFANKKVLDFGCSSGDFLFKLKAENISSELYALEPNKKYKSLLEKEFYYFDSIDKIPDGSLDYITLFHVLEHISDPIGVLNALYSKLKVGGEIVIEVPSCDDALIVIEVPSCDDALIGLYDNDAFQAFTYWSCHLFLFSRQTLSDVVKKTKFSLKYIKGVQRYTLANHLYWLSNGKPGGHVAWNFLDSELLNNAYADTLAKIDKTDTLIACIVKDAQL